MSTLSLMPCKWPSDFLFPEYKIPSNGQLLAERQKLAQFTFDLATQLRLPNCCAYAAITYLHRFLTIQTPTRIYPLRVCQASILLASKIEEHVRRVKDVYKCTANILKPKSSETSNIINFYINSIVDYENLIFATLGFGVFIDHPQDLICERIKNIQDILKNLKELFMYFITSIDLQNMYFYLDQYQSLPTKSFDDLKKMACYIEKQSILLTPFCIKYSVDLIAWFCIQLAIEIENGEMKSINWNNKLFPNEQIPNLINEFSVIYIKRSNVYKAKFANEENELGKILHKKALYYANLLEKKPVTLALVGEEVFVTPSSSVSNTNQQRSPLPALLSSTTASSSQDSYQYITNRTLSTNQMTTDSKLVNANNSAKRHYDSINESLSPKKRQKK